MSEANETYAALVVENDRLRIALATIKDHSNKVYQMGDAEARRALVDIYEFARAALARATPPPPRTAL